MSCRLLIASIRKRVFWLVVFLIACSDLQAQDFNTRFTFTLNPFIKSDFIFISQIQPNQTQDSEPTQFSKERMLITELTAYQQRKITDRYQLFHIKKDSSLTYQKAYPPQKADFRKLGYCTLVFVGTSIVVAAVVWTLPESASGWNKKEIKDTGLFTMWHENVTTGPVVDEDSDYYNYVTHPYAGAVYYMAARSSGFRPLGSFAYSAILSTLVWEYGIEAFAEAPSWQDLIITPTVGSLLGEVFFHAKRGILKNHSKVLKSKALGFVCLLVIDPFSTAVDGFGYKPKMKSNLSIAPIPYNRSNKPESVLGLKYTVRF